MNAGNIENTENVKTGRRLPEPLANAGRFAARVARRLTAPLAGMSHIWLAFILPIAVMALIYIAMVLLITLGIHLMERSLKKSDRRH